MALVLIEEEALVALLDERLELAVNKLLADLPKQANPEDDYIMGVEEISNYCGKGYRTVMNVINESKVEKLKKSGKAAIRYKYVKQLFIKK